MDRKAYKDEIKFKLTGGVLECELDDIALDRVLDSAFREVQRYISTTRLITIPFSRCIDLTEYKVNVVTGVYRTDGFGSTTDISGNSQVDPMMAAQWQLLSGSGGNMANMQNYILNYASWNTLLQIRNTVSTDLAYKFMRDENKLYINVSTGAPDRISIEFVPRYDDVSEVFSDYWIDIITRMSVAIAKVTLGRIRSRYTQSNALWQQDGATMLEEGKSELNELRQHLVDNTQLCYPID